MSVICKMSILAKLPIVSSMARIDRKSTRLNSSHDQISYAVFCLKKKKKKYNDQDNGHDQHPRSYPRREVLPNRLTRAADTRPDRRTVYETWLVNAAANSYASSGA